MHSSHTKQLFAAHIARLQACYADALGQLPGAEGMLLYSGTEQVYYADDQAVSFRAYGHFCHWLPVNRPDQAILVTPGRRPVYFQVVPPDYWYDQSIVNASWWADEFDIVTLNSIEQIRPCLRNPDRLAFLGEPDSLAMTIGIEPQYLNPRVLLNNLDFARARKTPYEIEQIRSANRLALQGHAAGRQTFLDGGSEYAIHMAYLQACQLTDPECPYTSIVALDEKAAILHYQHKRRHRPRDGEGQVLLIDAGHKVNNYCSDITRTTVRPGCNELFSQLLAGMEAIEERLVAAVRPGISYLDIHRSAMQQIAALGIDLGLISCNVEEALALNLPGLFMPHGVGHLLGLQVHDVGGHLCSADGEASPPPAEYPFLRNTRTLVPDMVFTIEPGFYFIPLLLDAERDTPRGRHLNWRLIDPLIPFGGIRVEDNVRVTADAVGNLTRQ
jgi:Xaa-Pro dipeptidase